MFARWGRAGAVKVDNGEPFGDPMGKSIPTLALWLISVGVIVIWNRPGQPTDNAVVERMQGTSKRWAEIAASANCAQLQARLNEVVRVQRMLYPVSRLGHRTRLEVYPALEGKKPIDAREHFNARRAYAYLAGTRLVRRVGKAGAVMLGGYPYQVGARYSGQQVWVGFDANERCWQIYDRNEGFIAEHKAKTMSPSHIWSMAVTRTEASKHSVEQIG